MNARKRLFQLIFLFVIVVPLKISSRADFGNSTEVSIDVRIRCFDRERSALLKFKDELTDKFGQLSSWGTTKECCEWSGVQCDNQTNHVVALNIRGVEGKISPWLLELQHLNYLAFIYSDFNGSRIPAFIGSMGRLQHLDLSFSNFGRSVPQHIGNLSQLQFLRLRSNPMLNISNLNWLSRLHSLRYLDLSLLNLKEATDWLQAINNLPQLQELHLRSCHLQSVNIPPSPTKNASNSLSVVDLSINELSSSSVIPWIFNLSNGLIELHLSYNNLQGPIPGAIGNLVFLEYLNLSYNGFNCSLPVLPPNGTVLLLSNNRFSGPLIILSNKTSWVRLDLSNNLLSGDFPHHLANLKHLEYLNLAHNKFSGKIPPLNMNSLSSLHLQNNDFTGEILASLKNCTLLKFIDLSENKLTGEIPALVGDNFPDLVFLSLRSNHFSGTIPSTLCHLTNIQVLDLSVNKISGVIPKCLNNLTNMIQVVESNTSFLFEFYHGIDFETANLMWKRTELEYYHTLDLMKLIDLSSNRLEGEIPSEITSLKSLVGLNLSRNNLSGFLSPNIGQLNFLNFLDLSRNQLCGPIPASLSHLDRLGVLDLSYNNLSGRIPWIDHLQTFNSSSYVGNFGLCGQPLSKACPGDEIDQQPNFNGSNNWMTNQEEDKLITREFYISMGIGFFSGVWGVMVNLVLNQSLRYAFFNSCNNIVDWLYVKMAICRRRW